MGRAFSIEHRRAFWIHIGIPFSNSLSKAIDPHINSAKLVRLSYNSNPDIREAVAKNLASRFRRIKDSCIENRLSSFEQKNLPRFNPITVIKAIELVGLEYGWFGDKEAFLCFFETASLSQQDIKTLLEVLSKEHSIQRQPNFLKFLEQCEKIVHLRKAQHPDTPVDEIVSYMVKEVHAYSHTWEKTETRTEWQQVGNYKQGLDQVAPVTETFSLGTKTSSGISYGNALVALRAHSREKRTAILQILKEQDFSLYEYIRKTDPTLVAESQPS